MVETPENATAYLKSLLGESVFFLILSFNNFLLDFAAAIIPSDKHRDTPCKFHKYFFILVIFVLFLFKCTSLQQLVFACYLRRI